MILKQGHKYEPMPHDGKTIWRIYRGGRCYYKDSPYSLAATQALKAAFPQYWTAIRDYGYAHPQLVPFINEDPMLIVSLVEVGKTRWLVGDGKAFISADYYPCGDTTFRSMFYEKNGAGSNTQQMNYSCLFGARESSTSWKLWLSTFNVQFSTGYFGYGQTTRYDGKINIGGINEVSYQGTTFISNGVSQTIPRVKYNITKNLYILAGNDGGSSTEMSKGWMAFLEIGHGEDQHHYLPFTRNGENGMLDILSGTFHPNANTQGSFTIEITDKA